MIALQSSARSAAVHPALLTLYFHLSSGLQFPSSTGVVPSIYGCHIPNDELCHSTMLFKFIFLTGIQNSAFFHPFHWGIGFAELTSQFDFFSFFSFLVLKLLLEENWHFWKGTLHTFKLADHRYRFVSLFLMVIIQIENLWNENALCNSKKYLRPYVFFFSF